MQSFEQLLHKRMFFRRVWVQAYITYEYGWGGKSSAFTKSIPRKLPVKEIRTLRWSFQIDLIARVWNKYQDRSLWWNIEILKRNITHPCRLRVRFYSSSTSMHWMVHLHGTFSWTRPNHDPRINFVTWVTLQDLFFIPLDPVSEESSVYLSLGLRRDSPRGITQETAQYQAE